MYWNSCAAFTSVNAPSSISYFLSSAGWSLFQVLPPAELGKGLCLWWHPVWNPWPLKIKFSPNLSCEIQTFCKKTPKLSDVAVQQGMVEGQSRRPPQGKGTFVFFPWCCIAIRKLARSGPTYGLFSKKGVLTWVPRWLTQAPMNLLDSGFNAKYVLPLRWPTCSAFYLR